MLGQFGNKGRILVVEDDPEGLCYFQSGLRHSGFAVVGTRNVSDAHRKVEEKGIHSFDAVLTDLKLPEESGLELLAWLAQNDDSLSTVIVTGRGEKESVKRTLELGGAGYLEKPVTHTVLVREMEKAVHRTRLARANRSRDRDLASASEVDQALNAAVPESLKDRLNVVYLPFHSLGGDFLNVWHCPERDEVLILVGDVAGHDLRAAYVAAYFQGIFRGQIAAGLNPDNALIKFNDLLRENTAIAHATLAICWVFIEEKHRRMTVYNCGFPPFWLVDRHGFVTRGDLGEHPLGWDKDQVVLPVSVDVSGANRLMICTDGVHDHAAMIGVDPLSYAYRLLHQQLSESNPNPSLDDILCISYDFKYHNQMNNSFEPIINEQYSGAEYVHIDSLQSVWRRSLQYSVGEHLQDRLYDLLICLREVMLNALIHGCSGSSEKFCHLQISFSEEENVVRVRVDDPGKGHQFDLRRRLGSIDNLSDGRQMGLSIVHHLSDDLRIENKGTSTVFDVVLDTSKVPTKKSY